MAIIATLAAVTLLASASVAAVTVELPPISDITGSPVAFDTHLSADLAMDYAWAALSPAELLSIARSMRGDGISLSTDILVNAGAATSEQQALALAGGYVGHLTPLERIEGNIPIAVDSPRTTWLMPLALVLLFPALLFYRRRRNKPRKPGVAWRWWGWSR